jgi:hypothetical protein
MGFESGQICAPTIEVRLKLTLKISDKENPVNKAINGVLKKTG